MNLDGTVSATNYDPNAARFTWYAVELLSYNVGFAYYPPDVVSMTNTAETIEPNTDYTNTVFITDAYKGVIIFNNFKLYDTVTTMDVTDEFVTKVADNMYRIVIPNISSDYMVSFETIRLTYTITSSLSNCVSSMYDESYTAGNALSWTITAAEGYTFDGGTYALTVGGVDITSTGMILNDDKTKFTMLVTSAQAIGDIVYVANAVEESAGTRVTQLVANLSLDDTIFYVKFNSTSVTSDDYDVKVYKKSGVTYIVSPSGTTSGSYGLSVETNIRVTGLTATVLADGAPSIHNSYYITFTGKSPMVSFSNVNQIKLAEIQSGDTTMTFYGDTE